MDPLAIVALYAPQYVDDPRLETALTLADGQIAEDHCQRELAVVLLALHTMEIADRAGSSGSVASKSEGGLSIAFTGGGNSGLLVTSFGTELDRINRMCYGFSARTAYTD